MPEKKVRDECLSLFCHPHLGDGTFTFLSLLHSAEAVTSQHKHYPLTRWLSDIKTADKSEIVWNSVRGGLGFVTPRVTPVLPINLVLLLQFSFQVSGEPWQPIWNMDLFAFDKASDILVEGCFKITVLHMAHIGWITLRIHIQSARLHSWSIWKKRCLSVCMYVKGHWNKTVGFQSGESVS